MAKKQTLHHPETEIRNDEQESAVLDPIDNNQHELMPNTSALLAQMEDFYRMVSNNSYYQNLFQGNLTPVKRKRRATPAIERVHKFDSNREGNYNLVKVFTHYPTAEYPTASTFIQFTKGNNSVFMRLNDIETLDHISAFLASVKVEIETLMPELKKMELTAVQKQNELEMQNQMQRQLIEQMMRGQSSEEE